VTDIISIGKRSDDELLKLAASLESQSEHPIAEGIVRGAEERQISFSPPKNFKAIPGKGAEAIVDGVRLKVVSQTRCGRVYETNVRRMFAGCSHISGTG
jgi:Cu2+-exporting ATPase